MRVPFIGKGQARGGEVGRDLAVPDVGVAVAVDGGKTRLE